MTARYVWLIDKRERDILDLLDSYNFEYKDAMGLPIEWRAEHLTTGDFILMDGANAILIIERKTWKDLAASIWDGRKHNIQKLIAYRESTGAKIAYLIEGAAFPASSKKFCRIPYKNLRAHLDHLLIRDNIIELRALNLSGTIERLFEFAKNISSIKISNIISLSTNTPPQSNEHPADTQAINTQPINTQAINTHSIATHQLTDIELAKCKQSPTESTIMQNIWCSIPHISSATYKLFMHISLTDLLCNKITIDTIAELSYNNGRQLGKKKAKKIIDACSSDTTFHIKLLSAIPNISKNTAETILSTYSLLQIFNNWNNIKNNIADMPRGHNKKKIGSTIINNIESYLLK